MLFRSRVCIYTCAHVCVCALQLREEHQKALVRRDFQLQSASLQTRLQHKLWSQERSLLLQESLQLKHSLLLLSLKLRCFLKQWRLGRRPQGEARDVLEVGNTPPSPWFTWCLHIGLVA